MIFENRIIFSLEEGGEMEEDRGRAKLLDAGLDGLQVGAQLVTNSKGFMNKIKVLGNEYINLIFHILIGRNSIRITIQNYY